MTNPDKVTYIHGQSQGDDSPTYHQIGHGDGGDGDGGDMWQQSVETRLSELRQDIVALRSETSDGFNDMRKSFDRVDEKFARVDEKFDRVGEKFDHMDDKRERDFRILFGAIIFVALGLAGLLARSFAWI